MTIKKQVLISGAGIAGLTAAWFLAELGWKVVVVEKATDLRAGGYLMSLSGPGYKVAEKMGVLHMLANEDTQIGTSVFRNKDGKKIWEINYPRALKDIDWVTLPRTRLVQALYQKVKQHADIRFGVYPQQILPKPHLSQITLSDASIMNVDLFIGADGLRSDSRELIFGRELNCIFPTGYRCAAFQFPNILNLGANAVNYGEPGRVTEFYSMGNQKLASLYLWKELHSPAVDHIPRHQVRQHLLSVYRGANPDVLKAIEAIPVDEEIYCDSVQMVKLPTWRSSRCLLLGDAAHCLTLASGQGASMAMTSAFILSEALKESDDIDAALENHDKRLRPTIDAIQERTAKILKGYVPSSRFGFGFRNIVFRLLPERWIGNYVAKSVKKEAARAVQALSEMS